MNLHQIMIMQLCLDGLVQIWTCGIVLVLNDWKNLASKSKKLKEIEKAFYKIAISYHLVAIETPLTCYGMLLLVIACTMRAINVYIHR